MSERITGAHIWDRVSRYGFAPQFWTDLAAQLDADATLATRLAEAERARDMWQRQVNDAHREALDAKAELARLRPLAAEAEAWEKIKAHPARDKAGALGFLPDDHRDGAVFCWAKNNGLVSVRAPTAVALLERLDALVKPKPEPEDWRLVAPDGFIGSVAYPSAETARVFRDASYYSWKGCAIMRRMVDPTTGVVTLTPAPEGA